MTVTSREPEAPVPGLEMLSFGGMPQKVFCVPWLHPLRTQPQGWAAVHVSLFPATSCYLN